MSARGHLFIICQKEEKTCTTLADTTKLNRLDTVTYVVPQVNETWVMYFMLVGKGRMSDGTWDKIITIPYYSALSGLKMVTFLRILLLIRHCHLKLCMLFYNEAIPE